jgi:hypothetical protein
VNIAGKRFSHGGDPLDKPPEPDYCSEPFPATPEEPVPGTIAKEFAQARFDQIEVAIGAGDAREVQRLGELARAEYVPVHDGLRDVVGATLDFAARATSPEEGEAIGRRVIERSMSSAGDAPQYAQPDLAERVRSIAAGWHWHATRFQVTEDGDKVTFRLDPCGSGMRLELEGRYDGPDGWIRSERGSPSTFMQSGFPMYSNHCAEMTRAGLAAGGASFVVEGWRERDCGVCFQHTYKRTDAVPAETYRRVGLEPPAARPGPSSVKRLFTDEELADLAVHPLDRAAKAVAAGDPVSARAALTECREAWSVSMHGAYRRWIALLWEEVCATIGGDALDGLLAATAPELVRHRRGGRPREWAGFWSMHLGLRSVRERGSRTEFWLDSSAVLEPGTGHVTPDRLCDGLRRGLRERDWRDAGAFDWVEDHIVHAVTYA